jgi:hypothetical protein
MYDIIFHSEPESDEQHLHLAFVHECQSAPLDFRTPFFYLARRKLIDEHIQCMRNQNQNSSSSSSSSVPVAFNIREYVHGFYAKHENELIVGLSWKWLVAHNIDEHTLIDICECLGCDAISSICARLARDYQYFHCGFPDLFMWDIERHECQIIEVKSSNDKLSSKQLEWLMYLKNQALLQNVILVNVCNKK